MNENDVVSYVVQALTLTLVLSMPAIAVASIVGTLFSLLQALTQIQEQTLSFAIKLVAVGLTLFLTASWLGGEMMNFTLAIFDHLPRVSR
jgi:type III secretion protein S